jgi:hypothetical protein
LLLAACRLCPQLRCFDATSQQACEASTDRKALQSTIDWKNYTEPASDVVCSL